jgi:hypothetical protein
MRKGRIPEMAAPLRARAGIDLLLHGLYHPRGPISIYPRGSSC